MAKTLIERFVHEEAGTSRKVVEEEVLKLTKKRVVCLSGTFDRVSGNRVGRVWHEGRMLGYEIPGGSDECYLTAAGRSRINPEG